MWDSGVPSNLDSLTDVAVAGPLNGDVLTYSSGTGLWGPAAGGGGGGGAPTTAPYLTSVAVGALSAEVVFGTSVMYAPDTGANMPAASATIIGALYPQTDASGSAGQGALYRSDGVSAWTRIAIDKGWTDVLYAGIAHNHAASEITSGTVATARLGSGTANSTTVLSGDQTYKQVADAQVASGAAIAVSKISGALVAASNLSDIANAGTARTNLGLAIGTNVQAWDADLDTIAGLTATTNNFLVSVASAWASRTPTQVRTTLALTIGTDVQAYDADLAAIAGLTSAADKLPYFTGSGTAAVADFTAAGRALVDDADAAAQRTTLGLGTIATVTKTPSGGDLTGDWPASALIATGPGATGPIGDSTHVSQVTIDAKGRVTALASVAISGGGSAFAWTVVTGASQTMVANNGYVANNAGLVTFTLPTVAAGDYFRIAGYGAGGWRVAQLSGQKIYANVQTGGAADGVNQTTTGTGGRVDSIDQYDAIELVAVSATAILLVGIKGTPTVT